MSLLPEGETLPSASGLYHKKFEEGKTRFRILETPILPYFEAWTQEGDKRRPVRAKTASEVEEIGYDKEPDKFGNIPRPKYMWGIKAFIYHSADDTSKGGEVKILTITQRSIMDYIETSSMSEDWKDATKYDITITRKGAGTDTKYVVQNNPPKVLISEEDEKEIFDIASRIDMDEIFVSGGDPFQNV
jgi:hypothetical protein